MVKEVVTDGQRQQPLDLSAVKAAYEDAQADFISRKHMTWATTIIQVACGSDAHLFDAAVFRREADLLFSAMRKFEEATDSPFMCGGPALMAAVIANYYSPAFVLDETIWELPVKEMAKVELALDAELGVAEVDARLHELLVAERAAETSPRPLLVGVALSSTMRDRIERGELDADMMARFGLLGPEAQRSVRAKPALKLVETKPAGE